MLSCNMIRHTTTNSTFPDIFYNCSSAGLDESGWRASSKIHFAVGDARLSFERPTVDVIVFWSILSSSSSLRDRFTYVLPSRITTQVRDCILGRLNHILDHSYTPSSNLDIQIHTPLGRQEIYHVWSYRCWTFGVSSSILYHPLLIRNI